MSDETSTPDAKPTATPAPVRRTGLSPAQQKLQAMRDKAQAKNNPHAATSAANSTAMPKNSFNGKKTAFQRKAT